MARVICRECHMEYNAALRACPNCGARRPRFWRRLAGLRWPLPLAIGLALQLLSQRAGPERGHAELRPASDLASASQFIAGMLVFSILAALLFFLVTRTWIELRRMNGRRRRRRARRRLHEGGGEP